MKNDIYKVGKSLGLNKKDIDNILSASPKQTGDKADAPAVDLYKSGGKYGTVSPQDIYKSGTDYGTVSPKEIYKSGTYYGTISPKDF